MLRSSNPLFSQRAAKRDLRKPRLLTQRFPTVHTGRLLQCPDVYVAKQEILDADNRAMHESKLWRLLLWLFLGNGGCQHRAWVAIKGMPCAKSYYRAKDSTAQPLEVLRFVAQL